MLVLWVVTAVIIAVAGLSSRVDIAAGSALFLALALASPALLFLAVGAVTSQLAPTRRRAAGYGAVVLGVSYCLRMLGDAGIGLHWLTWLSPLGWVERLAPLTSNDPVPLLPLFAARSCSPSSPSRCPARATWGRACCPTAPTAPPSLRSSAGSSASVSA